MPVAALSSPPAATASVSPESATEVPNVSKARVLDVQRFDLDDGQVQFRATVSLVDPSETKSVMSELAASLPGFRVSYVNLDVL